jgi:hypothetical protein
MEVRRFNLSSLLSVRCGIDFPWLAYRHLVDEALEPVPEFVDGIYWIDGTKDMVFGLRELARRPSGPHPGRSFLKPYVRPHVFAVFDRHDARPFVERYRKEAASAASASGRLVRRLGRRAAGRRG